MGYVEELGSRRFDEAPFGDRPEATDHSGGREGGRKGGREGGKEGEKEGSVGRVFIIDKDRKKRVRS